jgi:hypothetical protein
MNVKWIKQNLNVVLAVSAFVVLLIAAIWLQQRASGQRTQIEAALDEQAAQLRRLLSAKPFPSRENIEVLRQDYERLAQQYQALTQAVSRSSIQVPELRPVTFSQQLTKTLDRLARDAKNAHVATPPDFAFGFSRYVQALPARNLPEAEQKRVLGLLYKQLAVIEKLSELLFSNRVLGIAQIRRVEVEPGSASPEALDATITTDPNALYQTLPFEFEFTCNTGTLRAFLNSLSQSDWFFAVRTLKVESEKGAGGGGTTGDKPQPADGGKLLVTARISLVEFPAAAQPPAP